MSEHEGQSKPPTEEQIASLLASWQPLPSKRLDRRVADLSWNQRSKPMTRSQPARWARATLALLVLLVGVTLAVPSLRATAAELLGFVNAESDTMEKTITFVGPPPLTGAVAEVEAQAGFDVREPTYLSSGFVFHRAQYSNWNSTTLQYQRPNALPNPTIGIDPAIDVAQWRYNPDAEQFALGASANIENVSINGSAGQYVKGMWVPAPEPCNEDCEVEGPPPAPGDTANMRFSWNADVSIHVIRWQEGDMVYQVLAGGDEFTKDEVVKIAQSLR